MMRIIVVSIFGVSASRLWRREIDHQIKLHRQVDRLGALENPADVEGQIGGHHILRSVDNP